MIIDILFVKMLIVYYSSKKNSWTYSTLFLNTLVIPSDQIIKKNYKFYCIYYVETFHKEHGK